MYRLESEEKKTYIAPDNVIEIFTIIIPIARVSNIVQPYNYLYKCFQPGCGLLGLFEEFCSVWLLARHLWSNFKYLKHHNLPVGHFILTVGIHSKYSSKLHSCEIIVTGIIKLSWTGRDHFCWPLIRVGLSWSTTFECFFNFPVASEGDSFFNVQMKRFL